VCASGNYLGGTLWPPIVQYFIEWLGWRQTFIGIGVFCVVTMLPLALLMRRRPPVLALGVGTTGAPGTAGAQSTAIDLDRPLGVSPNTLQTLLFVAGISCCVAMAMPQVHIVAYCVDLGYGAARGAQMLAIMLGFGIISRLVSGVISDRIGGLRTLLLGSVLQGAALLLFLPFDGLLSLYVVSALFGLFQGGIIPSYALVVRKLFKPAQIAGRLSWVVSATLLGMALGGWLSGVIYDLTGSYQAAFINGIVWNLVNGLIVGTLLWRVKAIERRREAETGVFTRLA
jgi:predicted MFS family arabinose efflux permease